MDGRETYDCVVADGLGGYVVHQMKKKSGRSVAHCSVKGCSSRGGQGISMFRIPKMEPKCTQWKEVLDFTGDHKFANLTPEQCHAKIKVCSLHFASNCFSSANRIHSCAIPTLFLNGFENECDDEFIEEVSNDSLIQEKTLRTTLANKGVIDRVPATATSVSPFPMVINVKPESIVDVSPEEISGSLKMEEDSLDSMNFEPLPPNETFQKDQSTQTTMELTPVLIINAGGKRPAEEDLNQNLKPCKKIKRETTLEDVLQFFQKNYSTEACRLLIAQLDVLSSSKKNNLDLNNEGNLTGDLKHISIRRIQK